jgi:hypothetical protein
MEPIKISGLEPYSSIYLSTIGGHVWMNIMVKHGSANLQLDEKAVEQLIEALHKTVSEAESGG